VRDWVPLSNETREVDWVNFHLKHKDNVKETDGFIVDLTPPVLVNLGDGSVLHEDKTFQVGF
jgi:hypothetical protein